MPGNWETNRAIGGTIAEMVRFDLPDDYISTYPEKVKNLDLAKVRSAANESLKPDGFTWLIVGDKAQYIEKLEELGIEIKEVDVDGNIINEDIETPKPTESPIN